MAKKYRSKEKDMAAIRARKKERKRSENPVTSTNAPADSSEHQANQSLETNVSQTQPQTPATMTDFLRAMQQRAALYGPVKGDIFTFGLTDPQLSPAMTADVIRRYGFALSEVRGRFTLNDVRKTHSYLDSSYLRLEHSTGQRTRSAQDYEILYLPYCFCGEAVGKGVQIATSMGDFLFYQAKSGNVHDKLFKVVINVPFNKADMRHDESSAVFQRAYLEDTLYGIPRNHVVKDFLQGIPTQVLNIKTLEDCMLSESQFLLLVNRFKGCSPVYEFIKISEEQVHEYMRRSFFCDNSPYREATITEPIPRSL